MRNHDSLFLFLSGLFGNNEEQSAQCVEMKGTVAIWSNLRQVAAVVFLHLNIFRIQVQ